MNILYDSMNAIRAKAPVRSPVEMVYSTIRLIMELVLAKLYSDFRFLSRMTSVKARIVSAKTATAARALMAEMSAEA